LQESAPFRGVFKPTQRLSFFSEDAAPGTIVAGAGGTQGDWILQISDVAPNATMWVNIYNHKYLNH
jgi:hypothetical protein